ncbi:Uncharacterized protein TCAP_04854 [Tolypocladium capitatum]|uniref:Swiss Army Knife RNA repair protein HAD domain-containing protein n=1 Tax=Tolypocladium capitatum TaxID=45235 RepID=A0A2K3QCD5_9HYPO|nr:Uncharacterized protein TCAP_04854 [Tolypocladium capitatum]
MPDESPRTSLRWAASPSHVAGALPCHGCVRRRSTGWRWCLPRRLARHGAEPQRPFQRPFQRPRALQGAGSCSLAAAPPLELPPPPVRGFHPCSPNLARRLARARCASSPPPSSTRMIAARRLRPSLPSSAMASAYGAYHGAASGPQFTVTALGRWSVLNKQLPAVDKIKALHVYDFDNTLFKTPLPNPAVWSGPTIGMLANQDIFTNGGWWHDNRILAATGEGLDKEEPRAWDGWWNDKVVELVRLTIKQPDALCVLLTGRSEKAFSELIKRMAASKDLDFDLVGLKPQVSPTNQKFHSTMHFKQLFLNALMETYRHAVEIKVYEDRPKHTKGFREFFAEYNRRQTFAPTRGTLTAEVVQVADASTHLDPIVEVAEVQHMINLHNAALASRPPNPLQTRFQIKKTVFFTSYVIAADDSNKLKKLAQMPPEVQAHDLKYHANNILICPRPCPASILEKVGGMGSKVLWEVTGTACLDNSIWAARVRPVPPTAAYHTDNPVPLVVLALRKGARPVDAGKITSWVPLPPNQSFVFEATVREKMILRVEGEDPKEDAYESLFANKTSKRKHTDDDDWGHRQTHGHYGGRNDSRAYHSGRGGGARGRGGNPNRGGRNARGGARGGRGRGGGGYNYRSLDDVDPKGQQGGYGSQVNYGDAYQPPSQPPTGPRVPHGRGASQQGRGGGRPNNHHRPMGGGQTGNGADLQNYY